MLKVVTGLQINLNLILGHGVEISYAHIFYLTTSREKSRGRPRESLPACQTNRSVILCISVADTLQPSRLRRHRYSQLGGQQPRAEGTPISWLYGYVSMERVLSSSHLVWHRV